MRLGIQAIGKTSVVSFILEQSTPSVATGDDMVDYIFVLQAGQSWHFRPNFSRSSLSQALWSDDAVFSIPGRIKGDDDPRG